MNRDKLKNTLAGCFNREPGNNLITSYLLNDLISDYPQIDYEKY
jgi:hypothetical protein